jgi:hypothetical protein
MPHFALNNELFRLEATQVGLEGDGGLIHVAMGRNSRSPAISLTVEALLRILQSLPDAAGPVAVRRAVRRQEFATAGRSAAARRHPASKVGASVAPVDARQNGSLAERTGFSRQSIPQRLKELTRELEAIRVAEHIPIAEKTERHASLCRERERLSAELRAGA